MNYLIGEVMTTYKDTNSTISYIHHFLMNYEIVGKYF